MRYNITEQVERAHEYYDQLLTHNIAEISKLSGVEPEKLIKLNPADFIEKSQFQQIDGYRYIKIKDWIAENKTDETYLISPLDDIQKTANQISYKERKIKTSIRASKCEVVPIPARTAKQFCIRNHRQVLPHFSIRALNYGLIYNDILVAIMSYDYTSGGVRGNKAEAYELLRLAIKEGYQVNGGASRLQKHCESALRELGITKIMSYSNATINSGKVYRALGFEEKGLDGGQPYVIMKDFELIRLLNLHPYSTDRALADRGRIKTHLGGNKTWEKIITE